MIIIKKSLFGEIIKKYVVDNYNEIEMKLDELNVHDKKSYKTIHNNHILHIDLVRDNIMKIL